MLSVPEFDRFTARLGIDSLRDGVPPPDEVCEWLTMGQHRLIEGFQEGLKQATESQTNCRVLLGTPGAGKTHLFRVLRQAGKTGRFVIFQCTQDLVGRITFNRPDLVYAELIRSMELPAELTNGSDSLTVLLQMWGRSALPYIRSVSPSTNPIYRLPHQNLLPPAAAIHKRTAFALFGYLRALERDHADVQNVMTNVLRGMKIENRAIISAVQRVGIEPQFFGYTPTAYDIEYWFGQFGVICFMARTAPIAGCILLLDEIESLIDLNNVASRRKAYRVLSHIVTNATGIARLFTILSCTPSFILHLRSDVRAQGDHVYRQWEKLETSELCKLSRNDTVTLIEKVGTLYALAYSWDRPFELTARDESIAAEWMRAEASIGELVRNIVSTLDSSAMN